MTTIIGRGGAGRHTSIAGARRDQPPARRRAEPELGRHSFRAYEGDVLALEGVAELLGAEPEQIAALAESGDLPGRRIGGAWRFARGAVLERLGGRRRLGARRRRPVG